MCKGIVKTGRDCYFDQIACCIKGNPSKGIEVFFKSNLNQYLFYSLDLQLMNLLTSVNPIGQIRMLKTSKAIGERTLVELTSSCSNLSHYHAQQQLWAAIRGKGKITLLPYKLILENIYKHLNYSVPIYGTCNARRSPQACSSSFGRWFCSKS